MAVLDAWRPLSEVPSKLGSRLREAFAHKPRQKGTQHARRDFPPIGRRSPAAGGGPPAIGRRLLPREVVGYCAQVSPDGWRGLLRGGSVAPATAGDSPAAGSSNLPAGKRFLPWNGLPGGCQDEDSSCRELNSGVRYATEITATVTFKPRSIRFSLTHIPSWREAVAARRPQKASVW